MTSTTCLSAISDLWRQNCEPLADWTMARIMVRQDVYGVVLSDGKRLTEHRAIDRPLLIRHYRGEINVGLHLTSPDNVLQVSHRGYRCTR